MSENTEPEFPAGDQWPKLTVENFGPITKGEVELRPLTVFAGPSNTGKSWLAMLIYAMTRHVSEVYGFRGFRRFLRSRRTDVYDDGLENFPEDPAAWLRNLQEDGALRLTASEKQTLEAIVADEQEALQEEILRCFGVAESHDLVRRTNAGIASVIFVNATAPDSIGIRRLLTIDEKGDFFLSVDVMADEYRSSSGKFYEMFTETLEKVLDDLEDTDLDDGRPRGHSRYLRASILHLLVRNPFCLSTFYLPADRGGVMHAHRVVVGALIQSASRAGLSHRSPLPKLSGVLGDFLEQLIELADRRSRVPSMRNSSTDPADNLERNVLGGSVDIKTNDVDYPHFTYRPDGWNRDLSLMNVSSMVSELAPVALYLRHCVRSGDLLILEEPEAHLHPAMQVRLVREVAGWVRQGIRVLITTHSEWVLEEIANLVAAGESEKKDGLKRKHVGMWLFGSRELSGSNIQEIEWSVDEGGFALDFDDVAMELHNRWASLVRGVE